VGGARHGRVLRESEDYAVTRHSISLEQEPYFLTREQIDRIIGIRLKRGAACTGCVARVRWSRQ
jgi:hypothetical protein